VLDHELTNVFKHGNALDTKYEVDI